jgi:hypothetical protein
MYRTEIQIYIYTVCQWFQNEDYEEISSLCLSFWQSRMNSNADNNNQSWTSLTKKINSLDVVCWMGHVKGTGNSTLELAKGVWLERPGLVWSPFNFIMIEKVHSRLTLKAFEFTEDFED